VRAFAPAMVDVRAFASRCAPRERIERKRSIVLCVCHALFCFDYAFRMPFLRELTR